MSYTKSYNVTPYERLNLPYGLSFAKGGKVDSLQSQLSENGAQIAHFNAHELALMDELQGGRTKDPKTNLPEYFVLGEMLNSNPDLVEVLGNAFLDFHKKYAAHPHLNTNLKELAHEGRMGDTELAIIPDSLALILDELIGGPQFNPITGYREYFLGALMGLAARAIPMIASGAARLGSAALSGAGRIGSSVARMAPSLVRSAGTLGRAAATGARSLGKAAQSGLAFAARNAPTAMKYAGNLVQAGMMANDLVGSVMQARQQQQLQQQMQQQQDNAGEDYGGGYYEDPSAMNYGYEQMPEENYAQNPEYYEPSDNYYRNYYR